MEFHVEFPSTQSQELPLFLQCYFFSSSLPGPSNSSSNEDSSSVLPSPPDEDSSSVLPSPPASVLSGSILGKRHADATLMQSSTDDSAYSGHKRRKAGDCS